MALVFKRAVQVFVLIMVMNRVNTSRIIEDVAVSKLQKIPSYRFHYYGRDEKNEYPKQREESKNKDNVYGSYPNEAVRTIDYYAENSSELQTDVTTRAAIPLFKLVLNDTIHSSQQTDYSGSSNYSSINAHNQKQVKVDSGDHLMEDFYNSTELTEQMTTNQPEANMYDATDKQIMDQTSNQSDGLSNTQFELRLPLEKQSTVDSKDLKYFDDEVMRQNIIRVIENIKDHEQSNPELHFKSLFYKKLLKINDTMKTEPQKTYKTSLNKQLQLLGYNQTTIGSLYNMKLHHNQTSQIQKKLPAGFSVHGDKIKPQIHSSSTIQPISQQKNQKYLTPVIYKPLYYYVPNLMMLLPKSNGIIQNTYPIIEIKNQPTQQTESQKTININNIFRKRGKRSIEIPNGGSPNSSSSIEDTLDQTPEVNYNGHKHYGSPPIDPNTPINYMPRCHECRLFKIKAKRSLKIPVDYRINSDSMKSAFGQPSEVNYNGHEQYGSPPIDPNTPINYMPRCHECRLFKIKAKRSLKIPVDYRISSDSMKIALGQPPQVNYNGHRQHGSPPIDPNTPIDSMPICTDCGLGKIRDKRSLKIPVDYRISSDFMKSTVGQPSEVNYNGHEQYGSPPIDPNTPINYMPRCHECRIFKIKAKRSLKTPVDYRISSDSMKIALGQPPQVNYNGHRQYGSPPIDPNTPIDSMPICTDCGLGKIRDKRSLKIPVDYQINSDIMKSALGQPSEVNYNGHKQYGSPPIDPNTPINYMPRCHECRLFKIKAKRSLKIPVDYRISSDSMKSAFGQPSEVNYNGHEQYDSPPIDPNTPINYMPRCHECRLFKIKAKRSLKIPVDYQISSDSMKIALGQPPQVNYNGHRQYGSPPIDPNTPIDSMPICTDCGLGKIRDKRSLKIPVDYQINSDIMKSALGQPSEVNYNGHEQYGSPPIDPNTPINYMPRCHECRLFKIKAKRSIKIPVDYQISSDSMKIALGQPPHVNYNGHRQHGSPPIDPNTPIDSMPICTDCGLGKIRDKRSLKIPVDYPINSDIMKSAFGQPSEVNYNGQKQYGSPPIDPNTPIDSMPICTDCGLGKIKAKRSLKIPVDYRINSDSMKSAFGQPSEVNYNGHKQYGSPPIDPNIPIDSMPICTDCGLGKIRDKRSLKIPVDYRISSDSMKIALGQPPQPPRMSYSEMSEYFKMLKT